MEGEGKDGGLQKSGLTLYVVDNEFKAGMCAWNAVDAVGRVGLSAWQFQKLVSYTYLARNFG